MLAAVAAVRPDAVLVDITTVGAAAVAEAEGLPWARSIPLLQHFSFGPPASEVTMVPFAIAPAGIAVLNEPRQRLGLPAVTSGDLWCAPVELYYTAPPFEDASLDFPESFRPVGPGLWEPPSNPPEWLGDIDRPLILVSISSEFQRDDALVQVALDAMESEDVAVVVTTAAHDPDRFRTPANARVVGWLAHGEVVPRAALVVCHGGMGITQKALAAGVPVCVVPFGRDQFEVAARVEASGGGTVVMPDALSPDTLRAAIHEAMSMRAGAEAIAAGFARAGGPAAAADELEALVSAAPVQAVAATA